MMKVLIIAPFFNHEIAKQFNLDSSFNGGGWIDSFIKQLANKPLDLSYVVFNDKDNKSFIDGNIQYILHDYNNLASFFKEYDLIHVFGTEHHYLLKIKDYLDNDKTVYYIAGLISYCSIHYLANYDQYYKPNYFTKLVMKMNQKEFANRGKTEEEILKSAKNVIGRTKWDEVAVKFINPNINYYSCNEIMRNTFYTGKWNVDNIERNTIFVSQAEYSLKAAHMIVQIVRYVKKIKPNIKCYIGGCNLLKVNSLAAKLKISYASYIQKQIKEYALEDNIIFLGNLTSEEMKKQMLKCNVFLLPSSIENSSNSLSEAQLLGVPCVASYVGGIESIISKESVIVYPFDEAYMAAYEIVNIFDNDVIAKQLGENAYKNAHELFDSTKNGNRMYEIYQSIIKGVK